jgi:hypothetical protein
VENGQTNDPTNEFEVVQMLWVDTRVRVDLEGIVIVGGVFKQAVEGIEHFVRKEEKELAGIELASASKRNERLAMPTGKVHHSLDHPPHRTLSLVVS